MLQDQLTRGVFGRVELPQKRLHNLSRGNIRADPRVEVLIAPVLIGANKEHLNTGLPPLHVQTDDVRLRDPARVNALYRLYVRERLDPVPQSCCALKLHVITGSLHLSCERFLNFG